MEGIEVNASLTIILLVIHEIFQSFLFFHTSPGGRGGALFELSVEL